LIGQFIQLGGYTRVQPQFIDDFNFSMLHDL
jgi:hypothetical protein